MVETGSLLQARMMRGQMADMWFLAWLPVALSVLSRSLQAQRYHHALALGMHPMGFMKASDGT